MDHFSHDRTNAIWLASYPRSGNTFIRILLADCFEIPVAARVENNPSDLAIKRLTGSDRSTPRQSTIVKTHDYPEGEERFIYLVRDGISAILSYYHYLREIASNSCTIEDVIRGDVIFGSWSDHLAAWIPNIRPNHSILLRFEEFTAKPEAAIEALAGFLGRRPARSFKRKFTEMHAADPVFFRVGRNRTEEMTADQSHLFQECHGEQMRSLGYA